MRPFRLAATLALAAVMLVGGTAGAVAHDAGTARAGSASNTKAFCSKATGRLQRIHARASRVEAQVDRLQSLLARAERGNYADDVKLLQSRIDRRQDLDGQLGQAANLIASECSAT